MGWEALIAQLIAAIAPILLKWLEEWLKNRFEKAADGMPDLSSFPDEHAAREALFDRAVENTRGPIKKFFLRRLKALAAKMSVTSAGFTPPTAEQAEELADVAALVDSED